MFELMNSHEQRAVIKVIGVGGGGGNAVEHMLSQNIEGVDFICANTDAQALKKSGAPIIFQLGESITRGLGAGANPEVGRQAADSDRERLRGLLEGADMVFITAGMGGGTGTGAAPIVAEVAKELGALTVAVVTKPFGFEGRKRLQVAEAGIQSLAQSVDSLITIPNDKLISVLGKNVSLLDAFKAANNVLLGAVQGIADLITRPGLINVDFADVCTVMSEMGMAMMGTGVASGENRARSAAEAAVSSPLLDDIDLTGAKGVLVNVTAGLDMSIGEFEEVGEIIRSFTSDNATVVVGTVIDPELSDELRVTIVVTGLVSKLAKPIASVQPVSRSADIYNKTLFQEGSAPDYSQLDRPVSLRQSASSTRSTHVEPIVAAEQVSIAKPVAQTAPVETFEKNEDLDYLDIPAFLRRQQEESR